VSPLDVETPVEVTERERGSSTVAVIAILFGATFLGLVWLARDVDRARSNEGAAEAIAFQSARAGAQAATASALRGGEVVIDVAVAASSARATAAQLFASYGVDGTVTAIDVDVGQRRVRVDVRIVDGSLEVNGTGIVTVEEAP